MAQVQQRDVSVDIIKGIGIVLMVCGHSGAPFTHFVYLFHMAIFFIASGYCYKSAKAISNAAFVGFVRRKFRTMYFPYVLWMTIFILLNNCFLDIGVYTDNPEALPYMAVPKLGSYYTVGDFISHLSQAFVLHGHSLMAGAFWFIAALMVLSILYCLIDTLLRKITKEEAQVIRRQGVVSVVFLAIGYGIALTGRQIAGVGTIFSMYILFWLGYVAKMYGLSSRERPARHHGAIFAGCFAVLLLLNPLGNVNTGNNEYVNPAFLLTASIAGWQMLYEAGYFIRRCAALRDVIVIIGQNTLAILVLHFCAFKFISLAAIHYYGYPSYLLGTFPYISSLQGGWWVAYTIVGVGLPLALNLARKRIMQAMVARKTQA